MPKRANGDPDGRKVIVKWLKDGLKLRGKTTNDAADVIGMMRSHGPKLLAGRRITADEMFALSRWLSWPVPPLGAKNGDIITADSSPVVARVNDKTWMSHPLFNGEPHLLKETFLPIPVIPRPDLAGVRQFSVVVSGDLIDQDIRDGEFAICVPYDQARKQITADDYVLVQVERAGLFNALVLRLCKADGHWQLRTAHRDGRSDAVMTLNADCTVSVKPRSDEKVTFVGLVISKFAPLSANLS